MSELGANPQPVVENIPPESILFGRTEQMDIIRRSLLTIADTTIPVLITGESGTGKEVVCKYLHRHSRWGAGPFVKVRCPALAGTRLESELFVENQSSLLDETGKKSETVARGESGTLFVDEVSELNLTLQFRLLQVLQSGEFRPLGVSGASAIQVRVVCATNQQLQPEIEQERFRQDLYFRMTGLVLQLPPLRERVEDLELLVNYFVGVYNSEFLRCMPPVSQYCLMQMEDYSWPGNVRELENLVKRYVVLGSEDAILRELEHASTPDARRSRIGHASTGPQMVRSRESQMLLDALRRNHWDYRRTAEALQISYRAFLAKLKKAGIDGPFGMGSRGLEPQSLRNL